MEERQKFDCAWSNMATTGWGNSGRGREIYLLPTTDTARFIMSLLRYVGVFPFPVVLKLSPSCTGSKLQSRPRNSTDHSRVVTDPVNPPYSKPQHPLDFGPSQLIISRHIWTCSKAFLSLVLPSGLIHKMDLWPHTAACHSEPKPFILPKLTCRLIG